MATLIEELRTQGAEVTHAGSAEQPFLAVAGQRLLVEGDLVEVYLYPTSSAAAQTVAGIAPDGSAVRQPGRATMITWVGPPHFFRRGRLIVLYVGDRVGVLTPLEQVLGPQVAGR